MSSLQSIQGSELLSAPNESSGLQVSSLNQSSEESTVPSSPQTLNSFSTKPHSQTSTARTSTVPSTSLEATGTSSTESSWPTIAKTGPIATSTTQPMATTFISATPSSTASLHPKFSTSQTESTSEIATSLPGQQHPTRTSQMAATVPPSHVVNKPRRNSSENKYSSRMIAPDQVMTTLSTQSTPAGSGSYMQLQEQAGFPPNPSAGRPHSQGRGPLNAQLTPISTTGKMGVSNLNHPSPSNTTQAYGPTPQSGPTHKTPLPPWQQSMGNSLPTPALQRGPMSAMIQTTIQSSPVVAPYEQTTNDGSSHSRAHVSREPQRSHQTPSVDGNYQSQPPSTGNPHQTANQHQWDGPHQEEPLLIRGQNQYPPSDQNHQNRGQYSYNYKQAQVDYHHHDQLRKQQQYLGLQERQYKQEQQLQQQQQHSGLISGPYEQQQHSGLHQRVCQQQQQYASLHQGQYQQQQQQQQQNPSFNQRQYQQQQQNPGLNQGQYPQQHLIQQNQPQYPRVNEGQYQQQQQQQYFGLIQGHYQQQQQNQQYQGWNQGQYQQQQNEQQYADYNKGRLQNQQLRHQKHQLPHNSTQVSSQLKPHSDAPAQLVTVPSSSFGIGPTRVNNYSNSYSTQSGMYYNTSWDVP